MTVYAKIENNKLITAYNGYNGITGLADSPTLCEANGFKAYTEEEISGYYAGTYKIVDGVLTDITSTPEYIAEQLAKAKADKLQENITKRDARLIAGVSYKDILFDSDQDQKINLSAIASNMSDTDTITWFGKDGVSSLSCTKSDIENIGKLIISLTQNVWANINPMYINKINACKTIDEVNAIVIVY